MAITSFNNKKKRVGLFQLFRGIFIAEKQVKGITESKREFGKNIILCKGTPDPVMRLKYLDAAEEAFNKGKTLIYEMKAHQAKLFNREEQGEDVILESELEDMAAYISGLRIINKIAVEGYLYGGAIEKWTELLTWLGFDNPKVTMSFAISKLWKVIVIKDSVCRQLDDLPPDIIKKQQGARKILEKMGGKLYYKAAPSFGTRIIVMLPSKD